MEDTSPIKTKDKIDRINEEKKRRFNSLWLKVIEAAEQERQEAAG